MKWMDLEKKIGNEKDKVDVVRVKVELYELEMMGWTGIRLVAMTIKEI